MSRQLTVLSTKCISPSSGLSGLSPIFATIGGIAGGTIAAVTSAGLTIASGGLLLAASVGGVAISTVTGAGAGVTVVKGLDAVFGGIPDDLYMEINGGKVWPDAEKKSCYSKLKSQETLNLNYICNFDGEIKVGLWDYDTIDSDDLLGYIMIPADHSSGDFTYLVQNKDKGSIYELMIRISG